MPPLWSGRRVIVCVGTGGVGKTTVSATLAVAAAAAGLRTLVMTIDPARRLAHALGLTRLGNTEHQIDAALLAPYGVQLTAPLWAMMPDVKRTFDDLIHRWAPTPERATQILENRIYQHFSSALAGSHEYAAVEKLYEVYNSGKYDLIVLDTPPSQNAMDFLDAPGRIIDFLESDALQWLKRPTRLAGRLSLRLLDVGSNFVFKSIGKLAGTDTLRELTEFLLGFQGMYEGFRERSRAVRALLRSTDLAFVLVTATAPSQLRAMWRFRDELEAQDLPVRGVVLNRLRAPLLRTTAQPHLDARLDALLSPLPAPTANAMRNAIAEETFLAAADAAAASALRDRLGTRPLITLPELPLDAHDLASLARLHQAFL